MGTAKIRKKGFLASSIVGFELFKRRPFDRIAHDIGEQLERLVYRCVLLFVVLYHDGDAHRTPAAGAVSCGCDVHGSAAALRGLFCFLFVGHYVVHVQDGAFKLFLVQVHVFPDDAAPDTPPEELTQYRFRHVGCVQRGPTMPEPVPVMLLLFRRESTVPAAVY